MSQAATRLKLVGPSSATPAAGSKAGPATGPATRRLKRGELLFSEGENSRAMYLVKQGMLRVFKRKGDSDIEIDTIRAGQILGELAFLDGNPRSASAEALNEVELVEISGPTFVQVLQGAPEWLKLLLKTVVGRLRTASTRIRQLEQASSQVDYSDDGKRSTHYVFLSSYDVLKIASSLLLVAARHGNEIRVGLLQRYGNQIAGVPIAKITSLLEVLAQTGVVEMTPSSDGGNAIRVRDIDWLEGLIAYLNQENLTEPDKRHDLSVRGFVLMSLIAKHIARYTTEGSKTAQVNLAEIRSLETPEGGKEPFRYEEYPELVKLGYGSAINAKSATEMLTLIDADEFLQAYRYQRVVLAIQALNESKRKGAR